MSWEYWTPDEQEPSREELKAEIQKLLNKLADERTESMRLRAALREVMDDLTLIGKNHWLPVGLLDDVIYVNARAALEEGMTSPDEREDCTGLEGSSTANPCGREDCEEEGRT